MQIAIFTAPCGIVNNMEGLLHTGSANAAKQRGGGKATVFADVAVAREFRVILS